MGNAGSGLYRWWEKLSKLHLLKYTCPLSALAPTNSSINGKQQLELASNSIYFVRKDTGIGKSHNYSSERRQELTNPFPGQDHFNLNYCWQTHINPVLTNLQGWRLQGPFLQHQPLPQRWNLLWSMFQPQNLQPVDVLSSRIIIPNLEGPAIICRVSD